MQIQDCHCIYVCENPKQNMTPEIAHDIQWFSYPWVMQLRLKEHNHRGSQSSKQERRIFKVVTEDWSTGGENVKNTLKIGISNCHNSPKMSKKVRAFTHTQNVSLTSDEELDGEVMKRDGGW